jgi:hypothetical protein
MADFNELEAQLSDREPNTPHYLYELNNKTGRGQTDDTVTTESQHETGAV